MTLEAPICPFCGSVYGDASHVFRCDGRQGQVEALDYVPTEHVRRTEADTSQAAAQSLDADDVSVIQQRVYALLATPRTDEELLHAYERCYGPVAESTPRKRRCDLTRAGVVVASDERRRLVSGRFGIVWKRVTTTKGELV